MSAAEALERHFAEHYEPLFRFLRTCGAPEPVAEDLSQEAFLRLYQHLKEDRPGHNLRAWLFRVAYRLWVDRCRLGQRETGVQESVWEVWNQALRDPAPNVERELLARERREWLSAAMLRLSEVERQALHLRSDGLKYGEIAEVLGIGYWRVVEAVRRALDVLGEEAHGR
ncbi:MAG TPA: RNA polymerase sigma factor [Bryobacteraceae bacterium]|nr:RNA polymerase sigma factor [Bryobacteraceae bacterium]